MHIPEPFLPGIEMMIGDLETQRLEVSLCPALFGDGMIRVVESRNPEWYQQLCANHTKNRKDKRRRCQHRKHDTKIVRIRILNVLRNGLRTGYLNSIYALELLSYARGIVDELKAMQAAYEKAELQELGLSRSQIEQMDEAPF